MIAASGDWLVTAGTGDLNVGLPAGVNVYYRGEPVGGGGIYNFTDQNRTWNEWVPFLVPTRPGESRLESFAARGDTLVLAFEDSIPMTTSTGDRVTLEFDLDIVASDERLDFTLGGAYMLFFPMRTGEAFTITTHAAGVPDTTLVIRHDSRDWQRDFRGPSSYDVRSAHFWIDFSTAAPVVKVGIGRDAVGSGGLVKFDLDHSFGATPPRYYMTSRLLVMARY